MSTYSTGWFDYPHYGATAYRIWKKQTEHGAFQRNEWKLADGSVDMEPWIPTPDASVDGMTLCEEGAAA